MSALSVRYGQRMSDSRSGAKTAADVLLWENPSKTTARSSLDATLNQSIKNFSKIRVEYAYNTGSSSAPYYAIFPVFGKDGDYMFPSGSQKQRMSIGLNDASSNPYVRQFYVSSETEIHFNNAYRVNASANRNTNLIPWKIYGIKSGNGGGSSSGGGSSIPVYTGAYTVTPSPDGEQTLSTSGKQMIEDVTVEKIPYYETANLYGETIYIGVPEE